NSLSGLARRIFLRSAETVLIDAPESDGRRNCHKHCIYVVALYTLDHGRMAVDAHGKRVELPSAGECLIIKHEGVPSPFAIIGGEGISSPQTGPTTRGYAAPPPL